MKGAAEGMKRGLVSERDNEAYLAAQCVPVRERTGERMELPPIREGKEATGKKVVVTAKIMLDNNKLRGPNSLPQSRGYGFVEFSHHIYALACLREINNNSEYGVKYAQGGKGEPKKAANLIVEFSLENVQKV